MTGGWTDGAGGWSCARMGRWRVGVGWWWLGAVKAGQEPLSSLMQRRAHPQPPNHQPTHTNQPTPTEHPNQVRLQGQPRLQGRLPRRPRAGGPLQAGRGALRHRLAHLQCRRVWAVCDGGGQHGRRVHPGDREAADQGGNPLVRGGCGCRVLNCAGRACDLDSSAGLVPKPQQNASQPPAPNRSPPQAPPTMRFNFDGQMPEWLLAKDLILQVIGEISVAGATYKVGGMIYVRSVVLRAGWWGYAPSNRLWGAQAGGLVHAR
jgi:hypothetical protein